MDTLKTSLSSLKKIEEYIQQGNTNEAQRLLAQVKESLKILISGLETKNQSLEQLLSQTTIL